MYFLFNVIRYDKKTLNLIEMIYKEQFTRVKNSKFDLFALVPAWLNNKDDSVYPGSHIRVPKKHL